MGVGRLPRRAMTGSIGAASAVAANESAARALTIMTVSFGYEDAG